MNNKIIAEMGFGSIIGESMSQTQTGSELLNKYKSHLMANESTCALVNNFVKEASMCMYDNGVNRVLEAVTDYIRSNKTSWALATACESIRANNSSYNYLNLNACKQVEKLLEMEEDDVVKYIKAGALKNVMYCEAFRNIAKQVFKDQPIVEAHVDYTIAHPISITEYMGDGVCFEVNGTLYKIDEDKNIMEANWSEVSNTFKTITQLLESDITSVDNFEINVKVGNAEYIIKEENKVTRKGIDSTLEMTVEQLRDNNRLMINATNPRFKNQMAATLEAIALTCENYSHIVNMDNVSVYTTNRDKFVVIESGSNIYATLLNSNHSAKWTINENVIDALSFIKTHANVNISEHYKETVEQHLEQSTIDEREQIEKNLQDQKTNSYKERIANLIEKFKNDPVKLAVLSKLAQTIGEEVE